MGGDAINLPNFYVIGTKKGDDSSALYHEVCHALYEVNEAYRADVDAELDTISEGPMRRMKAWLRCQQYPNVERILQDEVHAYLSEGGTLGLKRRKVLNHTRSLQAIFSKHVGDLSYLLNDVTVQTDTSSTSEDD